MSEDSSDLRKSSSGELSPASRPASPPAYSGIEELWKGGGGGRDVHTSSTFRSPTATSGDGDDGLMMLPSRLSSVQPSLAPSQLYDFPDGWSTADNYSTMMEAPTAGFDDGSHLRSVREEAQKEESEHDESTTNSAQAKALEEMRAKGVNPDLHFDTEEEKPLSDLSAGNESYILDLAHQKEKRGKELKVEALQDAYGLYKIALKEGSPQSKELFSMIASAVLKEMKLKRAPLFKKQDQRLEAALAEELALRKQEGTMPEESDTDEESQANQSQRMIQCIKEEIRLKSNHEPERDPITKAAVQRVALALQDKQEDHRLTPSMRSNEKPVKRRTTKAIMSPKPENKKRKPNAKRIQEPDIEVGRLPMPQAPIPIESNVKEIEEIDKSIEMERRKWTKILCLSILLFLVADLALVAVFLIFNLNLISL